MGQTRVIFTDATTAEAISVFKTMGFMETPEGGCFLNPNSPLKIYSLWGKAMYYPDLFKQLDFTPRIQVHLKCKEETSILNEILQAGIQGFLDLASNTRIIVFNANTGEEVKTALLKD
jgi:hypothetical protein